VVAEETLVVTEMRLEFLPGFEDGEEGSIDTGKATDQLRRARRKPAILFDEFP
jgi:hypothetical protein